MVQGRRRGMRAILAGLLLCTALAVGAGHAQFKLQTARTDAEDIARGKALTEAGDCASCHTADPQNRSPGESGSIPRSAASIRPI